MANILIEAKSFGATVKDYVEGQNNLSELVTIVPLPSEGVGAEITVPVINFLGTAQEVKDAVMTYDDVKDESLTIKFKEYQKGVKFSNMELLTSYVDAVADMRALSLAESITEARETEILRALSESSIKMEVEVFDSSAVQKGRTALGQRLNQRDVYVVANATTVETIKAQILANDKREDNGQIYSSKIIILDNIPADEMYVMQTNAVNLYIPMDISVEEYRESDFSGKKMSANSIFGAGVVEPARVVKITKKP